jgi:RNA polymerase sigma factor (sigma-70 family)
MRSARLGSMLGSALSSLGAAPQSDAELLTRFLDARDETAFEALLVRHTPAVRAACWGWLRSAADVDDAAQATFLVLVRRAQSIRDRAAVGRWLYGVAVHVARRLRQEQRRHCPIPHDLPGRPIPLSDDLHELVAEEVARLPEKYRLPVQLCYAAGLSTAEAAQRLGWPKGTVLTRLAGARQRLQRSLSRRGVGPSWSAGTVWLATRPIAPQWVKATTAAVLCALAGKVPSGASEQTIALTEGVVRTMVWNKAKNMIVAAVLALGLVGWGIHHWVFAAQNGGDGPPSRTDSSLPAANDKGSVLQPVAEDKDPTRPEAPRPARRREAIIRLPSGTFVKEFDAGSYGAGRITFTYEEDRVLGLIEASAMGGEIELATEAEYALSSNGTIYGLITSVRISHIRVPDREELHELQPFLSVLPAALVAVEPFLNDLLMDLPFSYQFRMQGDRLVITNFRMLLAGPGPLGKVGAMFAGEAGIVLGGFQALGVALEGSYTATDSKDKEPPGKRPLLHKKGTSLDLKKKK